MQMSKRIKLFIIFGSVIITVSFLTLYISATGLLNNKSQELQANVTDGRFQASEQTAYFQGQPTKAPEQPGDLSFKTEADTLNQVLSAQADREKWIEVDLTNQRLRAWDGHNLVYEFIVSTGKRQWGTATPPGVYNIWVKLRYTKMSGGSGSTYYYLPNVQCVQYYYKGFGIHGTYWHNNFGHPMSHGCVNMRNEDTCTLFYWTSPQISHNQYVAWPSESEPGTKVVVHGETPLE
jgi:lipoprotein-anchoring transpeptidase ErfK/SrfK